MDSPKYTNLILDLGDVLLRWSAHTRTSIPARTLKQLLSSSIWHLYESSKLDQAECYRRLGDEFSLDPSTIAEAFSQARQSLAPNDELVALVRELRRLHPDLRVFAMSNISGPDYDYLRRERSETDWSIFDRVFTSADAGTRKPNLDFFDLVLAETRSDPTTTIFVDDKAENVLAARSTGIHGIVFSDDVPALSRALRNLLGDPVARGEEFLRSNAKNLVSVTDTGAKLEEHFTQVLIYEATGDKSLVNLPDVDANAGWQFNFFTPKGLTTIEFPNDLDTTSLTLSTLRPRPDQVQNALNGMLEYVSHDGVVQTYFDHKRIRIDPVVCVNVLTFFYSNGRGAELARTLTWVLAVLTTRAYADGTRYYETPECFLYFVGRLLSRAPASASELHATFRPLLLQRVMERVGAPGDALALAMRISLLAQLGGVVAERDLAALKALQCEDGGWPLCYVYHYGSSDVRVGSRGLATAFALNAIRAARTLLPSPLLAPPSPTETLVGEPPLSKAKVSAAAISGRHRRSSSLGDASRRFLQRILKRSGADGTASVVKVM